VLAPDELGASRQAPSGRPHPDGKGERQGQSRTLPPKTAALRSGLVRRLIEVRQACDERSPYFDRAARSIPGRTLRCWYAAQSKYLAGERRLDLRAARQRVREVAPHTPSRPRASALPERASRPLPSRGVARAYPAAPILGNALATPTNRAVPQFAGLNGVRGW
jgi:hypothetical protein